MSTRVRVPIQVKPAYVSEPASLAGVPEIADAVPPLVDRTVVSRKPPMQPKTRDVGRKTEYAIRDTQKSAEEESLDMWRDRAQRLQAEMENFRKRQQRLADERITADRERLLWAFLNVADDLERAMNADGTDVENLRQGVNLTYQTMARLLGQEGVELVQAKGQPFDPTWHEAVSTVPHQQTDAEPDAVVEVVQAGYRVGDRLLRPARVIVAT